MKFSVRMIVAQAMLAAVYAALTLLLYPISFGIIQCRVSEALTLLPFLYPSCTVGLTVGCLISNLIGGGGILDIVFGSLATLLACVITSKCRRPWLAPLPPVILNAAVVGAVLAYTSAESSFAAAFPLIALEVGAGEAIACYAIGFPLLKLYTRKGSALKGRVDSWMKR